MELNAPARAPGQPNLALAIDGGTPVRHDRLPLTQPWMGDAEADAAADAVRTRCLAGGGAHGRQAEALLSGALDGAHPLLMTSCSSALEVALALSGAGPGDEVLCPSFTFVSCANAIMRTGARPVFVDIDPGTLNVSPVDLQRAITPRTRAAIVVHYGGRACDMETILALADRHGFAVIEDAAHGLGARWHGRPLGTIGHFGCFSFHATKDVVCGEGGALVCRSTSDMRRAQTMREKGTNREAFLRGDVARYTWVSEGSSYVASDVLAAILSVQLAKLPRILERKRELAARLTAGLSPIAGLARLPAEWPEIESSWHLYPLLVDPAVRDRAISALHAEGIGATFHYIPLHSSPYARERLGYAADLPHTERVSASLIRLPLYTGMTDADADDVIAATVKVLTSVLRVP